MISEKLRYYTLLLQLFSAAMPFYITVLSAQIKLSLSGWVVYSPCFTKKSVRKVKKARTIPV